MDSYDVAVIGAGLAGLQCARLLGRAGIRVLLIDLKPSLKAQIHTTGIFVRRTLEDFVIPEDCLGPSLREVTLYSPAGRPLLLKSSSDEFRIGRMGRLYQRFLNDCQSLGVVWFPFTRYLRSVAQGIGSLIEVESGGQVRQLFVRFLVGADGAMSRVATDLGLDCNQEWIVGVEEVFSYVTLSGSSGIHCFLEPQLAPGYLAWWVHDGEEAHLGVGGYAGRFDPLRALQDFRLKISERFGLSQAQLVERRGGRIPVNGVLRRLACPRGLLVGDAAGAVSPLTAGGLDPCLRLSSLAASVVERYLATGNTETLSPYSGRRFRTRFISRRWMRRLIATIQDPFLLELACTVMRCPLFRPLAWHVFFGRRSFPDTGSELWASSAERESASRA
jgi:flavin-dependent dehydrogenase